MDTTACSVPSGAAVTGGQWLVPRQGRARRGTLIACRWLLVALAAGIAVQNRQSAFLLPSAPARPTTTLQFDGRHGVRQLAGASVPSGSQLRMRTARGAAAGAKELDTDALFKYGVALAVQISAIATFFFAVDTALASAQVVPPDWSIFGLFFFMSLRSRIFSPLDNSRPDIMKAAEGKATGGFNDRIMPSWTPPGVVFPIMWILIIAPVRAYSSLLIYQQVGHLCDVTILALMLHLTIGDIWNTINNVEKRLGAAVPGVLCVWASALLAAYAYYQALPLAGQTLLPLCVWLTVASALVTDTWRVNNPAGDEPLFPYRGAVRTQFWFAPE